MGAHLLVRDVGVVGGAPGRQRGVLVPVVERGVAAVGREAVAGVAGLLRHDCALDVVVGPLLRQRDAVALPVAGADLVRLAQDRVDLGVPHP